MRVDPAGCTTRPAGLSTTRRCSSSQTIGDIERFPSQRLDVRDLGRDLLASLEPEALGSWLTVDENEPACDQALGERAGGELGTCGEDAVEPRARLPPQERESGAVPTRGLARSAATNEAKSSPTPTTMNVSARLNAGQ